MRPRNNWVFVRLLTAEEKKPENQIVHEKPDETKLNKETIPAHVEAIGPKVHDVEVGDKVSLPGTYVTRKSACYTFIEEPEILGVIE